MTQPPDPSDLPDEVTTSGYGVTITLSISEGEGELTPSGIVTALERDIDAGGWRDHVLTRKLGTWYQRATPVEESRTSSSTIPGGTIQFSVDAGARPTPDEFNLVISRFIAQVGTLFTTPPE